MDDKFLTALGRICIAVVCLPLHIIIIWLFNTKQEYKKHTAFKIMTFLGVADSLHLIAQLMTASMVIWHLHTHPIFERISGALVLSTWDGMVGMIFVLALNRVVMVTQLSMTIFTTRKEYRKYVAFKIMTGLGIIDVLHLTGQFMAGCMIVFKLDVGAVYERVTGCLLMSMWCGMTGMNFVLATNRVIVLTQTKIRIIRAETLFYVLSGIAWSTYVSVICIHLTDEAAIDYKLHYKSSFGYRDTTLNSYMMSIESGWILTTLLLSFVCYIGIVLWLLFNKKLNVQHVKIERRELRILAQAIIVFAYMGANRSIWQFALRLVISAAIYTDIMVVLSCMIGMVNPLIYLYFNSGVRNQVLTFVGLKAMASSESSTIRVVTVKSLHRISF
ncbi:hypothetical protein QR680_016317 [Steinernema hermaphroditum]|uniref:Uncharacterized protein n=1 Tax=Steinernema hermaphroditum TaxID=289476 RepID=A0AA39HB39_9BILA|nr:hypothetical protein QR680_016317 [Steinernema hermaphroditum]